MSVVYVANWPRLNVCWKMLPKYRKNHLVQARFIGWRADIIPFIAPISNNSRPYRMGCWYAAVRPLVRKIDVFEPLDGLLWEIDLAHTIVNHQNLIPYERNVHQHYSLIKTSESLVVTGSRCAVYGFLSVDSYVLCRSMVPSTIKCMHYLFRPRMMLDSCCLLIQKTLTLYPLCNPKNFMEAKVGWRFKGAKCVEGGRLVKQEGLKIRR